MLLSFHHTKSQPFLVAGYVLVDKVIGVPFNLYCVCAVVVQPFVDALKVNEFTVTVHVDQFQLFHNASFALTLHVYVVHAVKLLVAVQLTLVGVQLWATELQVLLLHIWTSYHATVLHPLSLGAVHVNVGFWLLLSVNHNQLGAFGPLTSIPVINALAYPVPASFAATKQINFPFDELLNTRPLFDV